MTTLTTAGVTGLEGKVILGGLPLPLYRDPQRAGYPAFSKTMVSDQEGEPGQMVKEAWIGGWQEGMGEMVRLQPQSRGYAFGINMVPRGDYVGLAGRRIVGTLTGATTDVATYGFEDTDGTTLFIYLINGRYGRKMKVASNVITVEANHDFGASAACGMPSRFLSKWYAPLGASVDFVQLATIAATGAGDDTWTAVAGSLRALAFSNTQDGLTPYITRAFSTNQIARASANPLVAANWAQDPKTGTAWQVGDTSSAITGLIELANGQLLVPKTDDLYEWFTTGTAQPVFKLGKYTDASNGVGSFVLGSTGIIFYNHVRGLFCLWNGRIRAVGPDALPSNQYISNVTHVPRGGRHYEGVAASNEWIYSLYRVTESSTTHTYILAGHIRGGNPFDIEWQTFARESSDICRGLYVDSLRRLWTINVTDNTAVYYQLAQDGSPDPGRDSIGYGAASINYDFYLPEIDFGYPHTQKRLYSIEVRYDDITAATAATTAKLQLRYQLDGGTEKTLGVPISDPNTSWAERFFEVNDDLVDVEGYRLRPILRVTTGASYASTSDSVNPRVFSVIARAFLQPEMTGQYQFTVDSELSDWEPQEIHTHLQDMVGKLALLEGQNERAWVMVQKVSDLVVKHHDEGVNYVIDVTCRQVRGS